MARRIGGVRGRLSSGTIKGIDQGPTGQYAWAASSVGAEGHLYQTDNNYSGSTQSLVGIFSCWFYSLSDSLNDTDAMLNFNNSVGTLALNRVGLSNGTPTIGLFRVTNSTPPQNPVAVLNFASTTGITAETWHHLLISWDLTSGNTFADDVHMYLDDVSVKPGSATTFTDGTEVEWGTDVFGDARIGIGDSVVTTPDFRLAAWYMNWTEYLDFSVESNRRKFYDADGNPAALGTDGSLPTGNQPLFYFDNPVASLLTNRGSAGNFQTNSTLVDVTGPNP